MTARKLVAKVRNLPPVSSAALKLVGLLDQPALSNDEVVEVLKHDSVLTAKLLRACNSPYFGLDDEVYSVDQAIFMLGHNELLHIVLTLAFGGVMAMPMSGRTGEADTLWQHSLTTAAAAEALINNGLPVTFKAPVAFTTSLLHDIGKLVLGQVLSQDEYDHIRRLKAEKGWTDAQAEQEILDTDHAAVGASLLQSWNLPRMIVEAVARHHQPVTTPAPDMSCLVHASDWLANVSEGNYGAESRMDHLNAQVARALDISPTAVDPLLARLDERMEKEKHLMSA